MALAVAVGATCPLPAQTGAPDRTQARAPGDLPSTVLEVGVLGGRIGADGIASKTGLGVLAAVSYHRLPVIVIGRATAFGEFRVCLSGPCTGESATLYEVGLMAGCTVSSRRVGAAVAAGPGWVSARFPEDLGQERVGGLGVSMAAQVFYITAAGNGVGVHGFAYASPDIGQIGVSLAWRLSLSKPRG